MESPGEFLKADNLTTKDTKTNETATSVFLRPFVVIALCRPAPAQTYPCQQQFFRDWNNRPRLGSLWN